MANIRRIETMADVRAAIGGNASFAEELFKTIDADKEAFADERARGEGDGWIPTVEDIIQKELDGDGFDGWIIDEDGNAYFLEEFYNKEADTTFLMRSRSKDGGRVFCGWYCGEPNEDDTEEFYAEYRLA